MFNNQIIKELSLFSESSYKVAFKNPTFFDIKHIKAIINSKFNGGNDIKFILLPKKLLYFANSSFNSGTNLSKEVWFFLCFDHFSFFFYFLRLFYFRNSEMLSLVEQTLLENLSCLPVAVIFNNYSLIVCYFNMIWMIHIFFLIGVSCSLLLIGGLLSRYYFEIDVYKFLVKMYSFTLMFGSLLTLNIFFYIFYDFSEALVFERMFFINSFSIFVQFLIFLLAISILHISMYYELNNNFSSVEYLFLKIAVVIGSLFLVCSNSYISIYLSLELQTLPLYLLVSWQRSNKLSVEAGLKYFLLNVFSSSIFLFGLALNYSVSGLLNFSDLALFAYYASITVFDSSHYVFYLTMFYISLVLVIFAVFFKLTVVPFHFWTPEIYSGAPLSIVSLLATIPKLAVFVFVFNYFLVTLIAFSYFTCKVFLFFGACSILVGTLGAFKYDSVSKLVAFAGTAHMGFIFLIFGIFGVETIYPATFYIVVYMISTVLFFSVWLNTSVDGKPVRFIADLSGLNNNFKDYAAFLSIALFSYAGMPPLAGFMAKLLVFNFFLNANKLVFSIFIAFVSAISFVYYIRFIKVIYFSTTGSRNNVEIARFLSVQLINYSCSILLVLISFVFFYI